MKLCFLAAFCLLGSLLMAQTPERRLEELLMLPEPIVMRSPLSVVPQDAELTVLTPAKELADVPGILAYSAQDFKKLGISVETFAERAKKVADKRLAALKPDLIKDPEGKVLYAVYRSDQPLIASLLIAPSLPTVFEKLFGPEIWVALPDRHSLFIFPAKPEALEEFAPDLAERFRTDPRAASPEIFAIKKDTPPKVVGSFVQ